MGLSINGYKAIVEMQFADFVSTGFNLIVNLLAKSHYRWLKMLMLWFVCLWRNSSGAVSFSDQ
jgi:pyruvate/2-oxoglutarate/acetoin dehydrogenase E1 component